MKSIFITIASAIAIGFATLFAPQVTQQPNQTTPPQDTKLMAQETQQDNTVPFMRAKLTGSKRVLEGLVSEDYEMILQGATQMKLISEMIKWPKSEDPVYQHHSQEFRDQCDRLSDLAKAKNLQGAHYAYLHLTTNCFNCHNYVRKNFRVQPNPDPKGPVRLIPGTWEDETFLPDRTATLRR